MAGPLKSIFPALQKEKSELKACEEAAWDPAAPAMRGTGCRNEVGS